MSLRVLAFCATLVCAHVVAAQHAFVANEGRRLAAFDAMGALQWQMTLKGAPHDIRRLPNGHLLTHQGTEVIEIDPTTRKIVWSLNTKQYAKEARVELHSVVPLEHGGVAVALSGEGKILEIDRNGKVVRVIPLKRDRPHPHHDTRLIHRLSNGNYLVAQENDGAVREYAPDAKVVWEYHVPMFGRKAAPGHGPEAYGNAVFSAIRLPNGNTLIGTGNGHRVLEVTPEKTIVWQLDQHDLPGITLAWVTTIEVLPNGNLVIGNCHAGKDNPQLIEITRDKKVVWKFRDFKTLGNAVSNSVMCDTAPGAAGADYRVVSPPPEAARAPEFYHKAVSAHGYWIVGSDHVNDYALKEAAWLVDQLLAHRPDVRAAMIKSGSRMCVIAHDEFTTDLPEWKNMKPKDFWDARARGTGGSRTDPYCSCGEENLLGYPGDPYSTECILIHEFAHNIHLRGMVRVDPTFDGRVKAAYEAAKKKGLWKTKYASVNHHEYFAEGVQSWFDNNRENDHDHNHVNTRAELIEYDPGLAELCREVFGDTKLKYTKPVTRLTGHLQGYDPSTAPRFVWPKRLDAVRKDIRQKAQNRK